MISSPDHGVRSVSSCLSNSSEGGETRPPVGNAQELQQPVTEGERVSLEHGLHALFAVLVHSA